MANFDPNIWYQLVVDGNSSNSLSGSELFDEGKGAVVLAATDSTDNKQLWQLLAFNSSYYVLRTQSSSHLGFLAAGINANVVNPGKTVPEMRNSSLCDTSVFWGITPWGDGTFYFTNAANGTDWHLNGLANGLLTMDSNITAPQDQQRFSFTTQRAIDQINYSSVILPSALTTPANPSVSTSASTSATTPASTPASTPTSTSASTPVSTITGTMASTSASTTTSTPTSMLTSNPAPTTSKSAATISSSSSGLSTAAKAGIGIGIAVVTLVALLALGFLVLRRRKRRSPLATELPNQEIAPGSDAYANDKMRQPQELDPAEAARFEMEAGKVKDLSLYKPPGLDFGHGQKDVLAQLPTGEDAVHEMEASPTHLRSA